MKFLSAVLACIFSVQAVVSPALAGNTYGDGYNDAYEPTPVIQLTTEAQSLPNGDPYVLEIQGIDIATEGDAYHAFEYAQDFIENERATHPYESISVVYYDHSQPESLSLKEGALALARKAHVALEEVAPAPAVEKSLRSRFKSFFQRHTHGTLTLTRATVNGAAISATLMVTPNLPIEVALAQGIVGGSLSGGFQWFNKEFQAWLTGHKFDVWLDQLGVKNIKALGFARWVESFLRHAPADLFHLGITTGAGLLAAHQVGFPLDVTVPALLLNAGAGMLSQGSWETMNALDTEKEKTAISKAYANDPQMEELLARVQSKSNIRAFAISAGFTALVVGSTVHVPFTGVGLYLAGGTGVALRMGIGQTLGKLWSKVRRVFSGQKSPCAGLLEP